MVKLSDIAKEFLQEIKSTYLLTEVGEGVEPYPIRNILKGPKHYEAEFDVLSKEGIILDTIRLVTWIKRDPNITVVQCGPVVELVVGFTSTKSGYYKTTGVNQPFRVMSTVITYVKQLLEINKDINVISFEAVGQSSSEREKKMKLYNVFLNKELTSTFIEPSPYLLKSKYFNKAQRIAQSFQSCIISSFDEKGFLITAGTLNFEGQQLSYKNFKDQDLKHANFKEAILTKAIFRNASLQWANFEKAILDDAIFTGNKELSDVTFKGASLIKASFSDTDLSHAKCQGADFSFANFTKSEMQHINLQHAILYKANLRNANLQRAEVEGADLSKVLNLHTCTGLDTLEYNAKTKWPEGFDIKKYQ